MTEIPDRPFDKIAIDLVTDCKTSTSGNKHILTLIDHLTGWPEEFPIPDKSADTIVATFINEYLVHMCPNIFCLTMAQNSRTATWTKSYNSLGLIEFFSAPYHPRVMENWKFFHKYLKPTLKKLCERDSANWDSYLNQVLASYRITANLARVELPFFLVYDRDPNLPLLQLLEPM